MDVIGPIGPKASNGTGSSWWPLIILQRGGRSNFQISDQEGRGGFHPFQHHLSVWYSKGDYN